MAELESTMKTKQELATYQRKKYQSSKKYRMARIKYSVSWNKKNREQRNKSSRRRYANLSKTKKKAILTNLRKMRKAGLWKS